VLYAVVGSVVVVVVLVAAFMSLFVRRHGESDRPETGWRPTDEVFRDPATERLIRVWTDEIGRRHYLPERAGPPRSAR
jgi:hypothetical protein